MLRLTKTKASQYIVYIGWGGKYYADTLNDVNNVRWAYGDEKVKYEPIKR